MRPIPFAELVRGALAGFRAKDAVFDIPAGVFRPASGPAGSGPFPCAVGPAAGPHTQAAQNILAAYLAGARYFELKTVQKLDRLHVDKPCIDAADEGYNVEWSTELSIEEAYDEYLKAWFLLHLFGAPSSFVFNMSVGYDLEGIRTGKVDRFIDRLIDSSREERFREYRALAAELSSDAALWKGTPWEETARAAASRQIGAGICRSVTLSTMHGCPPREIEAIAVHLLSVKKLDTLVKLNPTLLGFTKVREILTALGYGSMELDPHGFGKDLAYGDAVPMLRRLLELGRVEGRVFGVKLSNTLACRNPGPALPGAERYMSGRALYPLTMGLAAELAAEFDGLLPISFSGGASAWNLERILACGIRPVTLATELLKPGGYGRLRQLSEIAERTAARPDLPRRVDAVAARRAAADAMTDPFYQKGFRGTARARVEGPLPLLDCFTAPCVEACPIRQDVPEYVALCGAGRWSEAMAAVWEKNPLPFMTGRLCDHRCMAPCTRRDWEGTVRIRPVKRMAAEQGFSDFRSSGASARRAAPRGLKAAVIGAGPAGMAAASFLAREGFQVELLERENDPGGVVRHALPGFRVPEGVIEKDAALLADLGVNLSLGRATVPGVRELLADGFRCVLVAVGASREKSCGIPGARSALSFLRAYRADPAAVRPGRTVAVIGAGDTAMDAARAALRSPGVEEVRVVYRRTEAEMPASAEEAAAAAAEGVRFHFLRAPQAWSAGRLVCRVMEMGAPDATGRRSPVPTEGTETIPADAVLAAVGAEVDEGALRALGLPDAQADARTQETGIPGVFLIGDAASGAATIVKAIASARRAVDAILEREGGSRLEPLSFALPAERGRRDGIVPASTEADGDASAARTEAARCLDCRTMCLKCVETCPNRANTWIRVEGGLRDDRQVLHLDAMCNGCGNCATFCPWDGKPYRDKLTLYATEADFLKGENPGFHLGGRSALRLDGRILPLDPDGGILTPAFLDARLEAVQAVIRTVVRSHPYLPGGKK